MDDASIRAALRDVGEMRLGVPAGHLRVMCEDLVRRGFDFDEVAQWVEARGGYVDRLERRRSGLGPNYGKLDVYESLIVPEDALRD